MGYRVIVILTLLGLAGCTPRNGTWRLYQDGTEIGAHKATELSIYPLVAEGEMNGGRHSNTPEQAGKYSPFPAAAVPMDRFWHQANTRGHRSAAPKQGAADHYVWVLGGITEVFVED